MQETEVLTTLGASMLFGRSTQAVRTAATKGRVETELFVEGLWGRTGQRTRLLKHESARKCWNRSYDYEALLEQMRRCSLVVEVDGHRYRVLHPWALVTYPTSYPARLVLK